MDSAAQANGEKRVRELLIDPLHMRGLVRPSGIKQADYDRMIKDLCARLAYMTDLNLAALEEQAAANPTGKDAERMPIPNRILEWAAQIQPPGDEASPLLRAVFAAQLGADAIREGWAPELLQDLKKYRRWPQATAVTRIRANAAEAEKRLQVMADRKSRGHELHPADVDWQGRRQAAQQKCERIAALGSQHGDER